MLQLSNSFSNPGRTYTNKVKFILNCVNTSFYTLWAKSHISFNVLVSTFFYHQWMTRASEICKGFIYVNMVALEMSDNILFPI